MITPVEAQQRSAELAHRFTSWTIWMTAQGSPVATRSGGQHPPDPYDGIWAQTLIADDWDTLETDLTAQATYDAERLSSRATYGLPYQANDISRVSSSIVAGAILRLPPKCQCV